MDNTEQILKRYLNKDGKINCLDAFKLARELQIEPSQIAVLTKKYSIKIDNCELGVFGSNTFGDARAEIYEKLSLQTNDKRQVECGVAWSVAKDFSLKKVGSTTKNSDLEVVYCQLGCFKTRIH